MKITTRFKTVWPGGQVSIRKLEPQPEFRNEAFNPVAGLEKAGEKKIVKVYERKGKRFDWDAKTDGSARCGKGFGVGRKFGNHFVCRQQMRNTDDCSHVCRPCLVVTCTSHTGSGWLSRFLNSVLGYLTNNKVKLSKLHGFLCSYVLPNW